MILTQSQVSVFLSSIIILLFTLALFLSGYVLQQKTITNLRAAIRPPQPPSHIYAVSARVSPAVLTADNIGARATDGEATGPPDAEDVREVYYLADAHRQSEHEKLPFLMSTLASTSPPARDETSWIGKAIHGWIVRVQGKREEEEEEGEGEGEEEPLESLGRAARRRRIKRDIQRLGSGEDVDFSRMYRPRKRGW